MPPGTYRPFHLGGDIGQADMRRITSTAQLGRELALEFSRVHPGQQPEPLWRELAAAALNHADYRETIKRSLSGLTYNNQAVLTPEIVQRMYRHELTGSVSRLETFAALSLQTFRLLCFEFTRTSRALSGGTGHGGLLP